MIKVIVLDDEWYNLEEVCDLVEKTDFMQVAGKYMNPLKALEEASSIHPQVAFIDIEMPEMDGLTFAEKLIEINPETIIAFITSWNQYAARAFDINALDYVMKPIKEERFQRLVEKIRTEISQNARNSYAERLISLYEKQSEGLKDGQSATIHLTERETQVLQLLAQGLTQREIAEQLYLSISSIKKYLASIYQKMEVNNKISAVQKARETYLL